MKPDTSVRVGGKSIVKLHSFLLTNKKVNAHQKKKNLTVSFRKFVGERG